MRRLFQRLTSSQERSISASPDAEGSSNGASSPSPLGFGHEELASAAALDMSYSAMEHFLPEFLFSVEFASDPSAWEAQLEKSWTRLEELLEITVRRFGRDSLDKVCELLSTICHLLVMEVNSQSEPSIGPILDQFFNEEILLQVQRWALKVPLNARPKCQMMLIRLYEYMVTAVRRFGRDSLDKVCELLSTICHLLVMEVNSQSEPSIGPILDQFFNEEILLQVQRWALKVPLNARPKCQMMLIRLYEYMVTSSQCPQSLLVHKPILMPLLQLLQWCRRSSADEQRHRCTADTTTAAHHQQRRAMATGVDRCFVRLINQICRKIAEDDTLLHFFFHSSVVTPRDSDEEHDDNEADKNGTGRHHLLIGNGGGSAVDGHQPSTEGGNKLNDGEEDNEQLEDHDRPDGEEKPFLVFDLLVPYLYAPEDVGHLARDALLLIMSVSKQHQFVADYVAQKSNFCPVLAAGLSGCFSQLPHCIFTELGVVDMDEFHKLSVLDAKTLPEISEFHNALLFCNAVAIVAHVSIVRQIVRFFYDGFLLEVFKSSVLEIIEFLICFYNFLPAMASAERGHQEEQERTRNFAYAAIAHSQLCLLMAAFALQHSAAAQLLTNLNRYSGHGSRAAEGPMESLGASHGAPGSPMPPLPAELPADPISSLLALFRPPPSFAVPPLPPLIPPTPATFAPPFTANFQQILPKNRPPPALSERRFLQQKSSTAPAAFSPRSFPIGELKTEKGKWNRTAAEVIGEWRRRMYKVLKSARKQRSREKKANSRERENISAVEEQQHHRHEHRQHHQHQHQQQPLVLFGPPPAVIDVRRANKLAKLFGVENAHNGTTRRGLGTPVPLWVLAL
uniref:Rap-GAP domain-containing protein n=1 Tax=Globodera pallida TaxID=36090 RepID=A0A183CEP5_GLOPA